MPSNLEEYKTVEQGVGLIEVPHPVLQFKGPDCKQFLQGAITNDIKQLKTDQSLFACHLNAKGRLIASFELLEGKEGIAVFISPEEAESLKKGIQSLIFFSQSELEDISDSYAWVLGIGKEAASFAKEISSLKLEVISENRWIYPAFLLLTPREKLEELFFSIQKIKTPYPVAKIGLETLEILRIESGIPRYGLDVSEKNLPQEAGFEASISYTKGCYIGQETVSRVKHYGHVNKHLTRLKLETPNADLVGQSIFSTEKELGKITSTVYSPRWKTVVGLAVLPQEVLESKKELIVKTNDGDITATLIP